MASFFTGAMKVTFDRSSHISTVLKDRFKGQYLKLEVYTQRLHENLKCGVMQSID